MTPKASSDFGLFKEKQIENNIKSIKFAVITVAVIILLPMIFYALIHLLKNNTDHSESTLEKPIPKAEKLVFAESLKREIVQNVAPKPFGLTYRGQPPSEFTSTTEKITTLRHPQIHYRHSYYPNNIQEVIGYASQYHQPSDTTTELFKKYHRIYKQSSSQYVPQNKRAIKNLMLIDNDPFYLFKPQDPGDINLLATANFRFAPPLWRSNTPKINSNQFHNLVNTKRQESFSKLKPVSLTVKIYPNRENEVRQHEYGGLTQFINQRIENLQSRIRVSDEKAKKMVIHLNLYPEEISVLESKTTEIQKSVPLKT